MYPEPFFFLAALVGAAVAFGAITLVRRGHFFRRFRGRLCPACGSTTIPLSPPGALRALRRRLHLRWCPGCGWRGLRLRPAHERPLRSGAVPLPGFRWARTRSPHPPPFVFGETVRPTAVPPVPQDDPDAPGDVAPSKGPLPGFHWAPPPPPGMAPTFFWGSPRPRVPRPPFRWHTTPAPPTGVPFRFATGEEEERALADRVRREHRRLLARVRRRSFFRWHRSA